MKNIVLLIAAFILVLLLTKVANNVPPPPPPGTTFALKEQKVIECSTDMIVLMDRHANPTRLQKDDKSWPDCTKFTKNSDIWWNFYLSRGEKTTYLSSENAAWWHNLI